MNRISIDLGVCNGRPVIRGRRIAAQTVLEFLVAGKSSEEVFEEYLEHLRVGINSMSELTEPVPGIVARVLPKMPGR
jgi:hypothetical protein